MSSVQSSGLYKDYVCSHDLLTKRLQGKTEAFSDQQHNWDKYAKKIIQYNCIYCLLDWRKNIHIVINVQQHDWLSTTWQKVKHGPGVHQTRSRRSGCSPVPQGSRTSWDTSSFLAGRSQAAGSATACEEGCASWRLSGSGLGPRCSWGPSAGFHTWTVVCPGPTGGPPYASNRRLCSNPASSSSLWRWRPSFASWQAQTSLASWSLVLRTQIQSQCSWLDETSWLLFFFFWLKEPEYVPRSDKSMELKFSDFSSGFLKGVPAKVRVLCAERL